ncbi:hypothetical protein P4V54_00300 [Brevibacillus nitrificans]|uniref:hypothetical protein n=1 Tax=Brevibacillus nitrificans TaxID=651560 RepID=UPI002E1A9161|nr:hypothetical protein [Brevibacillus nitrificans]
MADDKIQILLNCIIKNLKNRKVVIWGKCDASEAISKTLYEKYGIEVAYIVDSNPNLHNGTTVKSIDDILGRSKEIYVVIPLKYHQSIVDHLDRSGYTAMDDYAYYSHKPISVTHAQMDNYVYSDIYGNKIIGDIGNCKIVFLGYNSIVNIGKSTSAQENVEIFLEDDASLSIGDNFSIYRNTKWHLLPSAIVSIGDNCKFEEDSQLTCGKQSEIRIGNGTLFGSRYWMVANKQTQIKIGKDCLFSRDIMIRTNDGHSIFDIHTGRNINSLLKDQHKKSITINDHVWVGAKCTILYNSNIGKGSIVGAHSLTKKEYPNNCIIAGNPARVIKKDIAWSKENNAESMDIINGEYVNSTTEIN